VPPPVAPEHFVGPAWEFYFLPLSFMRLPCRLLGWPTPDDFYSFVQSRNAWVERVLSDVLLHEFGVQEGDRFNVLAK
jgi:hypothetical protein